MSDVKPLVSVVIPCYNTSSFLGEAIESALNQTYANLEVLVVDDGSTDDTRRVADRYLSDNRLKYIWQENRGLSSARNLGVRKASGIYVAFLDADDIWENDLVTAQVKLIESEKDCGMVFSDFRTFDEHGIVAYQKNTAIQDDIPVVNFNILIRRNNYIYPSTVLIRIDLVRKLKGFDESLHSAEDYDLWLKISKVSKILGINRPLVNIRQHSSNMSRNIMRMMDNERLVIDKYRQFIPFYAYRRRLAKVFLINADRSIHIGDRAGAFSLFLKGLMMWPFIWVDTIVVIVKLILGARVVELRRQLNNRKTIMSWLYWQIYKRY